MWYSIDKSKVALPGHLDWAGSRNMNIGKQIQAPGYLLP